MRNENFSKFYPELLDTAAAQALCETLKNSDIYVWGIDIYGLAFLSNFRDQGSDIVCFVDPNPLKQAFDYFGKKVISPEDLPKKIRENTGNCAVVIALPPNSTPGDNEAKNSLIAAGVPEKIICSLTFNKAIRPIPVPKNPENTDISDFDKLLLPSEFYTPCSIFEKEKIGVLMKVYRAPPQYIIRAVQSLREQSYKNIKITLLANDCLPETLTLLRAYRDLDNRIELIENPHNTWAIWEKENAAIYKKNIDRFLSDGDFFFLCDNDDYYAPDFLEKTIAVMRREDADFVGASAYVYREAGPTGLYSFVPPFSRKNFSGTVQIGNYLAEYGIQSPVIWGKLWSKKTIRSHFDFVLNGDGDSTIITPETIWTDDYIYINHLIPTLKKIAINPDLCYFWTRRGSSYTGNPDISSCFFSYAVLLPIVSNYLDNIAQKNDIMDYLLCHMGFYLGINLLERQIKSKPQEVKTALLKIKNYAAKNCNKEIIDAVKIKIDELLLLL
jgi:glycosyltransferase involved in cell wall biosynthesis